MADTPKKRVRSSRTKPKGPEFVTVERFEKLENGVGELLELMKKDRETPVARPIPAAATGAPELPETPVQKEIRKAGADAVQQVPVDWDEKAREILGDNLDHCEMTYGQNGGVRFIVVIKLEKSNAGKDYLSYYGQDRRTKDIAGEGLAGVENWCKLIAQNLSRPNIR